MGDQGFSPSTNSKSLLLEDRRSKPRLECYYPTTVKGYSSSGMRYHTHAVLANISASGIYLRTNHQITNGEVLNVIVSLSKTTIEQGNPFRLAATCKVVRVEPKYDGTYGVAMRIHRHRYL